MKISSHPVDGGPLKFNFYKPEDKLGDEYIEEDTDDPIIEDIPKTNTISGTMNYDPMVGNKTLGHTMPLPKNNTLLESNRNNEDDITCKKFIDKIKQGDGPQPKKSIKDKNKRAYNYIIENKKKARKESAKRKRSAKGRDLEKRLAKEEIEGKPVIHRKSYSEVIRDLNSQNNKI